MGHWGMRGRGSITSSYPATSTYEITVTADGSANTKGAWAEVCASSPYDVHSVIFEFRDSDCGAVQSFLLDVGIGSGGSEIVILSNLLYHCQNDSKGRDAIYRFEAPITVPSGTRIAARVQCSTGSGWVTCGIHFLRYGAFHLPMGLSCCSTYGAATGDSGGTELDPGATVNTWSSWVELSASTIYDIKTLVAAMNSPTGYNMLYSYFRMQIGVGAGGSEESIYEVITRGSLDTTGMPTLPFSLPSAINVPAGSRLAARAMCALNTANTRLVDSVVYGFS